jgi:predicted nucleic acid-binding protein
MNFAVDSSFALAWVFKDETTPETDKVLDSLGQGAKALVPALWRWEIANALLTAEKRKRATMAELNGHLLLLRSLPIEVDETAHDQAWNVTHSLAQKHKLTSYDAAYLELAIRRGLPLATLDSDLVAAAKVENVHLLPAK